LGLFSGSGSSSLKMGFLFAGAGWLGAFCAFLWMFNPNLSVDIVLVVCKWLGDELHGLEGKLSHVWLSLNRIRNLIRRPLLSR
jgi:hypothetical protein